MPAEAKGATETTKQMKYADVVRFETAARGSYQDLAYNPVFRSSALFYAVRGAGIDTALSFMNYWTIKNGNPDVSCLVTVRDRDGARKARQHFDIAEAVYRLTLSEMIADEDFEGSIEVEILSTRDLKYAMPAVQVFYSSHDGVAFVHANQRTFNSLEDLDRSQKFNGWQSGFDVYANDELSGFVGVVNGQRAVKDSSAKLQVYNEAGVRKDMTVSFGALPPYGARRINLGEMPEIRAHLGSGRGWCKVIIDTDGVFNRLVCGNMSADKRRLSVTHSYYDLAGSIDYVPQESIKATEYPAVLPLPLLDGVDLDIVFYPIYSDCDLNIDIERRDPLGRVTHLATQAGRFRVADNRALVLDIKRLLRDRQMPVDGACNLVVTGAGDSRIPARLTVGVNYRQGKIGSNLSGTVFTTIGYGVRPRFYAWGPALIRDGGRNYVLLCHLDKKRDSVEPCEITVTLYGRKGAIGSRTLTTANGSCTTVEVEQWLKDFGYQPAEDEFVWYDALASRHVYSAYELHRSAEGFVGCDHSY